MPTVQRTMISCIRGTRSVSRVSLPFLFLTSFCLERRCPDTWCASGKLCISQYRMCKGQKDCTESFDDEPDNCGKIMKCYSIFRLFKPDSITACFQANVCTVLDQNK